MNLGSERYQDEQTLQEYAAKLLSESLVTGVPSIVKAPNWVSKGFKLGVLVISLCGFLYQTVTFLSYVLEYPSVVDVHVKTPKRMPLPAYTICSNNGIRRSKYCEKYPDHCETPENKTEFCRDYPRYCSDEMDWSKFKVPKSEFLSYEKNITYQELKELGHVLTFPEHGGLVGENNKKSDIQGPFVLFKEAQYGYLCNTINSRVDDSAELKMIRFPQYNFVKLQMFVIDVEPEETFLPWRTPGVLFSIHSPFDFVNPYDTGFFLKEGQKYSFYYTLEETMLLPFPYGNGCTNYTLTWLNNGKMGPRNREMCVEECEMKLVQNICNSCVDKYLVYPFPVNACFTDEFQCPEMDGIYWPICQSECKDSCHNMKLKVFAKESPPEEFHADFNTSDPKLKRIVVDIYASNAQVIVYKHRPHYQTIEVFSYIGGYIGVWLGISLVAVTDLFESIYHMVVFAYRSKKRNSESKRTLQQKK